MNTEKIILSFIAIVIGIFVAGVGFYLYQSAKISPATKTKTVVNVQTTPTPTPKSGLFLTIDTPKDEEVFDKKTLRITGKTSPEATIVITTKNTDDVIAPASNGSFTTTTTIDDGENIIEVTALTPDGEQTRITKTVTYSTENF